MLSWLSFTGANALTNSPLSTAYHTQCQWSKLSNYLVKILILITIFFLFRFVTFHKLCIWMDICLLLTECAVTFLQHTGKSFSKLKKNSFKIEFTPRLKTDFRSSDLSRSDLAQLCAESERFVGTQGGGMDQAACLLSSQGAAQLIHFNPLCCEPVTLPPGAAFVVASSLQTMNKAATSDFNCRVVECRLACHILNKQNGIPRQEVATLAKLHTRLGKTLQEMLGMVYKTFHEGPYTLQEVSDLLEMPCESVKAELLSDNTRHLEAFMLRKRAEHVFSEALRVERFKEICVNPKDCEFFSSFLSNDFLCRFPPMLCMPFWINA